MATKAVAAWYQRGVPNALLKRTVRNSPQEVGRTIQACGNCKYWAEKYPGHSYDPASQASFVKLTSGVCQNLRIAAAYGEFLEMSSYYTCSFFERKEKENG